MLGCLIRARWAAIAVLTGTGVVLDLVAAVARHRLPTAMTRDAAGEGPHSEVAVVRAA
jgi:hypothetical protein